MTTEAYQNALKFLFDRIDYERSSVPYHSPDFKLDRMRELLDRLGNPHRGLDCVHIAGTKGKGSTAAMFAAVAQSANYRVGIFTSPHLNAIEERISVDTTPLSPVQLSELVDEVRDAVRATDATQRSDQDGPTFFEITTAMAFLHFRRQDVRLAILEVGLGGRLDSTNVCEPIATVISSISFDHVRQLGNTLTAIAGEKAGIIKPGIPVISGVVADEPQQVIASIAARNGAPLFQANREFWFDFYPQSFAADPQVPTILDYHESIEGKCHSWLQLPLSMRGFHQASNAALVCATVRRMNDAGWRFPESAVRNGLATTRCHARVELVAVEPVVILDVAHNAASAEALLEALPRQSFPRRILVFAASRDKDVAGMFQALVPAFDVLIMTRFIHNPRAHDPQQLADLCDQIASNSQISKREVYVTDSPNAAWQTAMRIATPRDLVCITGSFFLAAEISPCLNH